MRLLVQKLYPIEDYESVGAETVRTEQGDVVNAIMTEYQFIKDYNMRDCDYCEGYAVYLIEGFEKFVKLHREVVDWNGCHIVFARDDNNEVVVDGYGEDH